MKINKSGSRPVRIVVIGAGNRANKYLEYAREHPDELQLVGVAEINELRRRAFSRTFGLAEEACYDDYDALFAAGIDADMALVATPDHAHVDPVLKAIQAGWHVLLEKPIAQQLDACLEIARLAREHHVLVGVCHVLRYHPYFLKIKELVDSGIFGQVVSVSHTVSVGLDRAMHSYVRGMYRREADSNPMLLAKCCHDIDFLLWITGGRCRRLSSFGSLHWFRKESAPKGCADRCVDCPTEPQCPYSARDLYYVRKKWISNFDIPEGMTLDEAILEELHTGPYGRCVFCCDNDVVDHQVLALDQEDGVTVNLSMDMFTADDLRKTRIRLTNGEINGNECSLHATQFRGDYDQTFDFSEILGQPLHAGADLRLVEDFIHAINNPGHRFRTSIDDSIDSHRVCYAAERSRRSGETVRLDQ